MNDFKIIIFAAPSSAGKSTVVQHLLGKRKDLALSVSATTREPRPGEVNGKDYWFLSVADFEKHIAEGNFLEWEENFPGKYYGTLKSEIDRVHENGQHLLVDCEFRGAENIKNLYEDKVLYVFVTAPTIDEYERRLRERNTESEEAIQERLDQIKFNVPHRHKADYILVNDNLDQTFQSADRLVQLFIDEGKNPDEIVQELPSGDLDI